MVEQESRNFEYKNVKQVFEHISCYQKRNKIRKLYKIDQYDMIQEDHQITLYTPIPIKINIMEELLNSYSRINTELDVCMYIDLKTSKNAW